MSTASPCTHVGYADESHWNEGGFRALALLTLPLKQAGLAQSVIAGLLKDSAVSEMKWKKLRGAKYRFAALKTCRQVVDWASDNLLRLDVLVWDIEDSRHRVANRDDVANLQRMYYHLMKQVFSKRWPDGATWRLHPDEHGAMDWNSVEDFVGRAGLVLETQPRLDIPWAFHARLKREFSVETIVPVDSNAEPLIQVADLFAGLAVFSREHYGRFSRWQEADSGHPRLPGFDVGPVATSGADDERFEVLREFNAMCKEKKMRVSLKTNGGLRTMDPRSPINFWWYEPQHPADRAPTVKGE